MGFGAIVAFVKANAWVRYLLAAGLALIVIAVVLNRVREAGRNDIRQEDAAAVAAQKVKADKARQIAAEEAGRDAAATAAQHEEQTNAIHATPDSAPGARDVRRRCVQLRQQGEDISRIPACRGSAPAR